VPLPTTVKVKPKAKPLRAVELRERLTKRMAELPWSQTSSPGAPPNQALLLSKARPVGKLKRATEAAPLA